MGSDQRMLEWIIRVLVALIIIVILWQILMFLL
ncbi:MAG: hypothetical protein AWU59_862 [Methanolobus sp. T82-4]|jgi:hypothetical protein|nr:MAG: hypothetical protein AWU59_862 [Methanolobus sp. T82-4]